MTDGVPLNSAILIQKENNMELNDFLALLLTAGGAAAVASWVLERIPAYASIAVAETKRWVFFGVCAILALGSYCVITFVPPATLQAITPYFAILASVFSSVFFGTSFHNADKLSASGTVDNPIITADVKSTTAKAISASKESDGAG
jgi:hypothetical protein